jgi:hypothetical protein
MTHVPLVEHFAVPPFTSPQVWPAATTVFRTHALVAASQVSSSEPSHPGPVACFGSHVAPTVLAAAWHVPAFVFVSPTHVKPIPQGVAAPQLAPACPATTHAPEAQVSPPRLPQSASTAQAAPAAGTAAHVPQVASAPTAQNVLWHCELVVQAAPVATEPASAAQAVGGLSPKRSAQLSLGSAPAHASKVAAVEAVPGAARSATQTATLFASHAVSSPQWISL